MKVVAIGKVDGSLLAYVAAALGGAFGRRVDTTRIPLDGSTGYDVRRRQYLAEPIMRHICPVPGEHVLGVVDLDVYAPPMKYVVGIVDRPGRRALVALPRLRRSDSLDDECFLVRVAAEATYQMGRTFEAEDPSYVQAVAAMSSWVTGNFPWSPAFPDTFPDGPCQDGLW